MKKQVTVTKKKKVSFLETKFKAASTPGKRVMIAQDIIEQVNARKYRSNKGSYVAIHTDSEDMNFDIKSGFDKIKHCNVCALGACIMSATRFKNKLFANDVDMEDSVGLAENDKVRTLLQSLFSNSQLFMIEEAFEGAAGSRLADELGYKGARSSDLESCLLFHNRYKGNADKRLIAICENIIKNKGTFRP